MKLTFDQKRKLFNSYPLQEYTTKPDKLNYRYKNKTIISEFRHTGNCYIWGKELSQYSKTYVVDDRGWINVTDFNEEKLRTLLEAVMKNQDLINPQ